LPIFIFCVTWRSSRHRGHLWRKNKTHRAFV